MRSEVQMLLFRSAWSLVTLSVAFVVHKIIMGAIEKFTETVGREVKAPKTLSLLVALLIYGFAVAAVLAIWDLNLLPYLTGLGISGIVLGLAFQEPLTNFLSGILVLVTRKVFEGEVVDVDGLSGTVDVIKVNHTHLRTFDGKLVLIPNRKVWAGTVTKYWPGRFRRVDIDVTVDYSSDLNDVIQVVKSALADEPLVAKDPHVENSVIFKLFDKNGVTYTVRFWVERETFADAVNAVAARLKSYFEQNQIRIPRSVVEVRFTGRLPES